MAELSKKNHKIDVQYSEGETPDGDLGCLVKKAILTALKSEAVDMLCVINVLITDDKEIGEYNKNYRCVDSFTDVLSFPMQEFSRAGWHGLIQAEIDEETGDLPLGDVIISLETVKRQAIDYGNSIEYEMIYLTTHSTLHLLGYVHDNIDDEKLMHIKSKEIIKEMGFTVNDK